jgi:hypothetical protein
MHTRSGARLNGDSHTTIGQDLHGGELNNATTAGFYGARLVPNDTSNRRRNRFHLADDQT